MWSLRQKSDGSFYLTYDLERRYFHGPRGIWDLLGKQGVQDVNKCVAINTRDGHLCANDDQGNVRVLVLEDK